MGKQHNKRRDTTARNHLREAKSEEDSGKVVFYSDAAISPEGTGLAAINTTTGNLVVYKLKETIAPKEAELKAILMAVDYADPQKDCLVYTDSKTAYEECRNVSTYNE